jgi:hypothetical protein
MKDKELVPTDMSKSFEKADLLGTKKNRLKDEDLPVMSQKKTASSVTESRVPKMEKSKCKSKDNIVSGHAMKLYGREEGNCTHPYPRH